jgi:hypothetical protein
MTGSNGWPIRFHQPGYQGKQGVSIPRYPARTGIIFGRELVTGASPSWVHGAPDLAGDRPGTE